MGDHSLVREPSVDLHIKIACFVKMYFQYKNQLIRASWCKEVNCTYPSPLVRIIWLRPPSILFKCCVDQMFFYRKSRDHLFGCCLPREWYSSSLYEASFAVRTSAKLAESRKLLLKGKAQYG
jgi:hypothetical protein